jgi:hypothetical protein
MSNETQQGIKKAIDGPRLQAAIEALIVLGQRIISASKGYARDMPSQLADESEGEGDG